MCGARNTGVPTQHMMHCAIRRRVWWRSWVLTDGGVHEAVAVEGQVVVSVLGHLRLFIGHAAQGAGGAGVLLAATLSLHWHKDGKSSRMITCSIYVMFFVSQQDFVVVPHEKLAMILGAYKLAELFVLGCSGTDCCEI